jgi:hypothetical protein
MVNPLRALFSFGRKQPAEKETPEPFLFYPDNEHHKRLFVRNVLTPEQCLSLAERVSDWRIAYRKTQPENTRFREGTALSM